MDEYINAHNEIAKGGDWLRAARNWMQSNVPRGDVLSWSDRQPVMVPFAALEDLARAVAVATVLAERQVDNAAEAAARERCARACDDEARRWESDGKGPATEARLCAARIRALR